MNKIQNMSHNATLNSVELMDVISNNIFGYAMNGHRAKRYAFSDFMNGGEIRDTGYNWSQGKQEPRIGEWTKVMIKGRGFFTVKNPRSQEHIYTRLGDFHLDAEGNLVTIEGYKVQGIPLAGAATKVHGHPADVNVYETFNPAFSDPYYNPHTNNRQYMNAPGQTLGPSSDINLALDRRNGRYLGAFDELRVGEDGVIYGRDGNNMVSLYKLSVVDFNNLNGLQDVKDGVFFKATDRSGLPTFNVSDSLIIPEALEKSNSWVKVEAHNLTDAQRYFQAATQVHKLADKISGTAIEMIQ